MDGTAAIVLDLALGIKDILLTKTLADPARPLLDLAYPRVFDYRCSVTVSIKPPVSRSFCYLVVACGSGSAYALRKIVPESPLRCCLPVVIDAEASRFDSPQPTPLIWPEPCVRITVAMTLYSGLTFANSYAYHAAINEQLNSTNEPAVFRGHE